MLVSITCFAANSLLLKLLARRAVDPWLSLSARFALGLALTMVLLAPELKRCFRNRLLVSRGILGGLATICFYFSVGPLGAGKATLIGTLWPVFATAGAVLILGERLALGNSLGIALALGGLALLTGVELGAIRPPSCWELTGLAGSVLAAAVVLVIRELTRTESSATIFTSQCLFGLLLGLPFAFVRFEPIAAADWALVGLASACAAAGQLSMTEGFRFLAVATGGALQIVVPLVVSIGGVIFFDERFTLLQAGGGGLILAGAALALRRSP